MQCLFDAFSAGASDAAGEAKFMKDGISRAILGELSQARNAVPRIGDIAHEKKSVVRPTPPPRPHQPTEAYMGRASRHGRLVPARNSQKGPGNADMPR